MPGRSIGMMKYEMPVYFDVSVSVRAMRMPNFATWASDVQIFWPLTTNTSPSRTARVRQVGEVGAGLGLGEELAPHLLAAEHRRQVALLLLLGAVHDEHRTAVADADRVHRLGHAGAAQLVVDDQLQLGLGVEAPRPRPVRHDVAGVDQVGRASGCGCSSNQRRTSTRRGSSSRGRSMSTAAIEAGWPISRRTGWSRAAVPVAPARTTPGPSSPRAASDGNMSGSIGYCVRWAARAATLRSTTARTSITVVGRAPEPPSAGRRPRRGRPARWHRPAPPTGWPACREKIEAGHRLQRDDVRRAGLVAGHAQLAEELARGPAAGGRCGSRPARPGRPRPRPRG